MRGLDLQTITAIDRHDFVPVGRQCLVPVPDDDLFVDSGSENAVGDDLLLHWELLHQSIQKVSLGMCLVLSWTA